MIFFLFSADPELASSQYDKKEVYFMRHGETRANKEGKTAGKDADDDDPLSEIGEKQAEEARPIIEGLKTVRLIISSPLQRTDKTAKIANTNRKLLIEIDPNLKEISRNPPESEAAFRARIKDCLKRFLARDESALIVSHSNVGHMLRKLLLGVDKRTPDGQFTFDIRNAIVLRFVNDNGTWSMQELKNN